MKTAAIFYIGIDDYINFFPSFYESAECFFLPEYSKRYFVWSNREGGPFERVMYCKQESLGWPGNTLKRFDFFLQQKEAWQQCDVVFFCNANTLFQAVIHEQELFQQALYCAVTWDDFLNRTAIDFPLESRKSSTAYVDRKNCHTYFQGGFFGGKQEAMQVLISSCAQAIASDEANKIVARVHDESHLNAFFLTHVVNRLSIEYGHPQEWQGSEKAKIMFRKKELWLDPKWLKSLKAERGPVESLWNRCLRRVRKWLQQHM